MRFPVLFFFPPKSILLETSYINSFLVSRNLFTFMFGGQYSVQWAHKSDVRSADGCLPSASAITDVGSRRTRTVISRFLFNQLVWSVLESIRLIHCFSKFMNVACGSVRIKCAKNENSNDIIPQYEPHAGSRICIHV